MVDTGILDSPPQPPVWDGVELRGRVNTDEARILEHVAVNIRRGYPQVRPQAIKPEEVCIVGGGPSLQDTEAELVDLVMRGAKVVALNGAAAWCRARNLRPSAQIIMDARPGNVAFVEPDIPQCRYLLASQCHPSVFEACEGRNVWIWHAENDGAILQVLDAYYLKKWKGIVGGTTAVTRALILMRMLGYLRFHLFGIDSCWKGDQHHAYPQALNDVDQRFRFDAYPSDRPELKRTFWVAPWHVKQAEDVIQTLRLNGHLFRVQVHGDGLLAFMLHGSADTLTPHDDDKE